jgi:hypothetical protein
MAIHALLPVLVLASGLNVAAQQVPMGPVRIEPPGGGGNPIVVTVVGVEQDPTPVASKWNPAERSLHASPAEGR